MGKYVLRRLLWMIPIVLGVSIIVFTLMTLCPGDPAQIISGAGASEEDLQLIRESLGLNDPFIVRLGRFLSDTFIRFDFGKSWMTGAKINEQIAFLRKQKGLTQEELAGVLGVTNQAVSKWESAQCCPDIQLLPDIAKLFDVSVDELLGYKKTDGLGDICLKIKDY